VRFKVKNLDFRIWVRFEGYEFGFQDLGEVLNFTFRVESLGFRVRVRASGFRVSNLGLWV
jgi:hypothetical protein